MNNPIFTSNFFFKKFYFDSYPQWKDNKRVNLGHDVADSDESSTQGHRIWLKEGEKESNVDNC